VKFGNYIHDIWASKQIFGQIFVRSQAVFSSYGLGQKCLLGKVKR